MCQATGWPPRTVRYRRAIWSAGSARNRAVCLPTAARSSTSRSSPNRPDPDGGEGLDLIRWQRGKAGTVEHAHRVLKDELAAEALPSQKFGANAASFRLNVMLYNLLSAFKRIALPPELHDARPKRLRFVLLNGIGRVIRHAREIVLRLVGEARRQLADAAKLALATGPPLLVSA